MPSLSISKQTQVLKETETRSSSRARVLLSKEEKGSMEEVGEASFRVYYGATGAAVPFMWETQPGTPKHPIFDDKSNDDIVPPLTPPPSYNSSSRKTMCRKSWSFSTLFSSSSFSASSRRRSTSHVTPTPSLSSSSYSSGHIRSSSTSSSTSSFASLSSPHPSAGRKKQMYHKRSASSLCFSSGHKSLLLGDDAGSRSPPCSTMCFGFSKKQGCYSMEDVKNAILSI